MGVCAIRGVPSTTVQALRHPLRQFWETCFERGRGCFPELGHIAALAYARTLTIELLFFRRGPRGLKPTLISESLRGPEKLLLHEDRHNREFLRSL